MAEEYEVKVQVGDATIEVRGARDGVVAIVEALSTILSQPRQQRRSEEKPPATTRSRATVDARSFFQEKSPSSQAEAISVAAYYLAELAPPGMSSHTIDKLLAQDVLRQAKFPIPKRLDQALVNTASAGYLARVGPGEYKLTPVGWNLVEHTLGS